jgi:hypothetical protein
MIYWVYFGMVYFGYTVICIWRMYGVSYDVQVYFLIGFFVDSFIDLVLADFFLVMEIF